MRWSIGPPLPNRRDEMKILKFNISADGTTLNVTPNAENSNISQYEVVKVQVDLDSATLYPNETERCAVILNLLPPTTTVPSSVSDYTVKMHMIPDPSTRKRFYLYLNEALGRNMIVGTQNLVYYDFQIYRNATLLSQNISASNTIALYKTNLSTHYAQDDFSNLFAGLQALEDKLNG